MAKTSYSCKICSDINPDFEKFVLESPYEVSHHRVNAQETKCGFGLQGACCTLCANGPCRISPDSPRGICGADVDSIVARNFLRAITAGTSCYLHVAENSANRLLEHIAAGKKIVGTKTVEYLCDLLDITADTPEDGAKKIIDKFFNDLHMSSTKDLKLVEKLVLDSRYKKWNEIGVLPGGVNAKILTSLVKTSTNLNTDPVDMMLDSISLGILTGVYGLTMTNYINDIIMGEPTIHSTSVGMQVIDPEYINILVTGHQQSLLTYIEELLRKPETQERAREKGAKGIKIIGTTCVGQDLQMREIENSEIFSGYAGNNYTSELILSTGAIDLVLSEFNCTLPGIETICDELHIPRFCLDEVAKLSSATVVASDNLDKQAQEILDMAIHAYADRRADVSYRLLESHGNNDTMTGFTEVTLKEALGGSLQPLIDSILGNQIKGVVGVVGCSNLVSGGHDVLTVKMTEELIKKDILVVSAGCTSGGLQNEGLMSLSAISKAGDGLAALCKELNVPPVLNFGPCLGIGRIDLLVSEIAKVLSVDIPELPVALSAPQWLEEQALADGAYALALGLPLHLGATPFVTGSKIVTNILTENLKDLTGGYLLLSEDPVEAANLIENSIVQKRYNLSI